MGSEKKGSGVLVYDTLPESKKKWYPELNASVERISRYPKEESVLVIIPTGGGKTIVTIGVVEEQRKTIPAYRALMFTETRYLAEYGHQALVRYITGAPTRGITGVTAHTKRTWEGNAVMTFATPHVAKIDIQKNTLHAEQFNLLIFDEAQLAKGSYPFTWLFQHAKEKRIQRILLSAVPGWPSDIERLCRRAGVSRIVCPEIKTPGHHETKFVIPFDETIKELETKFATLFGRITEELKEAHVNLPAQWVSNRSMPEKTLEALESAIDAKEFGREKFTALKLYAAHRVVANCVRIARTEGYAVLLKKIEGLKKDSRKCTQWLKEEKALREIETIARNAPAEHPLITSCLEIIGSMAQAKQRVLLFFREKETARWMLEKAREKGIKAEVVFGGKERDLALQEKALEKVGKGELDAVFATSVIRRGVSVPDLHVGWFSLPPDAESLINGKGRSARAGKKGILMYWIADCPEERAKFFAVWKQARMLEEFYTDMAHVQKETGIDSLELIALTLKYQRAQGKKVKVSARAEEKVSYTDIVYGGDEWTRSTGSLNAVLGNDSGVHESPIKVPRFIEFPMGKIIPRIKKRKKKVPEEQTNLLDGAP